jgi:hypothetical protein
MVASDAIGGLVSLGFHPPQFVVSTYPTCFLEYLLHVLRRVKG